MSQSASETEKHARNTLASCWHSPPRPFVHEKKVGPHQRQAWRLMGVLAKSMAVLVSMTCQSGFAQQQSAAQLPNGASAINEIYGDWVVDCRIVDGQKLCGLSQAQGDGRTGQRIFVIELRHPRDGKADGSILMPFGVSLERGASLKLDDNEFGEPLRFTTCLPQGCLLAVSLSVGIADPIRKASKLTVSSINQTSGETITFTISLKGFGAAVERIAQLAR